MFWLKNKTVMITGGTGSFGQQCAQFLLEHSQIKRLILFSRDEQKHVRLKRTLFPPSKYPQVRFFVGDVRDEQRLKFALRDVDFVIHAAAMKHVDMAEYNPHECISTNVAGAKNVIHASIECGVEKVITLSSDKAASPINLYGATKLCSDKLFVASNSLSGKGGTRFSVVRYGNVLNTSGSVVPFFQEQQTRGVLPITDPDMTRFIITLEQGVAFVLESMQRMFGGEIFVPKTPSTKVLDIAKAVAPECKTEIVGIRPGEKLHECMISEDESRLAVEFEDYFIIRPPQRLWTNEIPYYDISGTPCPRGFSYTSDKNSQKLSVDDLRDLIDEPEEPATIRMPVAAQHTQPTNTLPYSKQEINQQDVDAVLKVLRSGWLTTGPVVKEFEEAVADYVSTDNAVSFSNGTAALHGAMAAAGIGPGDEVIVPSITFVATANAVSYCGATPVFADVDPDTLLIDPQDVVRKVSRRTRAVITMDYAGQPCDYPAFKKIADQNQLLLIADSCHSIGATSYGRPIPEWVDMACYSFHPVKPMTTCEGGMVATSNQEFATALRSFRNHGISTDHHQRAQAGTCFYDMQSLGFNYRLSDVHCALGISQLGRLANWRERREAISETYRQELKTLYGVSPLKIERGVVHAHHLFVVRWSESATGVSRDAAITQLREAGIRANVHYRPVYDHSFYRNRFENNKDFACPNADLVYPELISLPIFPAMESEDVKRVMTELRWIAESARHSSFKKAA